jgi:hypothetical protein
MPDECRGDLPACAGTHHGQRTAAPGAGFCRWTAITHNLANNPGRRRGTYRRCAVVAFGLATASINHLTGAAAPPRLIWPHYAGRMIIFGIDARTF